MVFPLVGKAKLPAARVHGLATGHPVAYLGYNSLMDMVVMGKTATIRARIEPGLKRSAEAVLKKIGLTPSEAITLFLMQVKLQKGLPFPVRVPNRATRRAITEADSGKAVERFSSVKAWSDEARSI
jgi:DNA-damage-inducible protein J